jgi:hypothetical protein
MFEGGVKLDRFDCQKILLIGLFQKTGLKFFEMPEFKIEV